jgi:hypothetical protein
VHATAGLRELVREHVADFLERFQAVDGEPGRDHVDVKHALRGQSLQRVARRRPDPLLAAELRLVGQRPLRRVQPERRRDRLRRGFALALVRVAAADEALGQAVVREQQVPPVAGAVTRGADAVGDGGDPAGIEVVLLDHRRPAHVDARDHVLHRRGGRGRILRIERQHDDAFDALALELREHAVQRRPAVAHRIDHAHVRHLRLHRARQAPRVHRERRAAVLAVDPDRRVLLRHRLAAQRQDHEVQQRAPDPARHVDHAMVVQEFRQVATYVAGRGRVGRAEVGEDEGGARGVHRHSMTAAAHPTPLRVATQRYAACGCLVFMPASLA